MPRSSCELCREKTRKVEEFCLRNQLGNTRISLGIQTRHPEERPDNINFKVTENDGSVRIVSRPKENLPIFLAMPVYPAARLLSSILERRLEPPAGNEWFYFSNYDDLKDISGDGGAVKIGSIDFLAFARLLAKMAHGFLVCERGLGKFHPLTTELIRQETTEYWHGVGGTVDWFVPERTDDIFQMQSFTHQSGYVFVRIRIFPNLDAPTYHVVAGKEF